MEPMEAGERGSEWMENGGPSNATVDLMTGPSVDATADPGLDSAPTGTPGVATAGAPTSTACLRGRQIPREAEAEQE